MPRRETGNALCGAETIRHYRRIAGWASANAGAGDRQWQRPTLGQFMLCDGGEEAGVGPVFLVGRSAMAAAVEGAGSAGYAFPAISR